MPNGLTWSWRVPLIVMAALLGVLALTRLAIGIAALGEPAQLDYGEPIIYAQAQRILNGQPLYLPLDRPPYSVTAYTPLYYKVVSELAARIGPGFAPGRAVSFAAMLVAASGIGWLAAHTLQVGRTSASVLVGLLAALIFIGLGFSGGVPWFALYRVDVLAEAFSIAVIVVLSRGVSVRYVLVAALLAGLAILTKQTYIAALLAGTAWLWSIGRRGRASFYATTSVALVAVVCLYANRATGSFLANAVAGNLNPFNLVQVPEFLVQLLQTLGLPIVIATIYVVGTSAWRRGARRLLVVYWVASALPLFALVKFGANANYWIELAGSTAVLAAVGLWSAARWSMRTRAALVWLLAANTALVTSVVIGETASSLIAGSGWLGVKQETDVEFGALVDLVRGEPGPVLGDPLDEVVLAGRPVLLEPVIYSLFEDYAAWDPDGLVQSICAGQVQLLVLGAPLEVVAQYAPNGEPWWPPRVMHALETEMRPAGQIAGRYLYTPAPSDGTPGCG